MISVAEALTMVLEGVSLVSSEEVPLADALGRVLAEDVASRVSHPPVAVSAMDGYAVMAKDVTESPVTLNRIGDTSGQWSFRSNHHQVDTVHSGHRRDGTHVSDPNSLDRRSQFG